MNKEGWSLSLPCLSPVNKSNQEEIKMKKLYSYYMSSCSHRVRIALLFEGLAYEYVPVDLRKREQFSPDYSDISPLNYVPTLVDDGIPVADSFPIIMYLEAKYPQNPLLPTDPQKKAINIQKLFKVEASEKIACLKHHIGKCFSALEELLKGHAGTYATGDNVFLADLFLAPQIHAAINRFGLDMATSDPNNHRQSIPAVAMVSFVALCLTESVSSVIKAE